MTPGSARSAIRPWNTEMYELVRAASGGLLFGVPLLYTMEVWWTGTRTQPLQMLVVLILLAVPVFVLNKTEGFRATRDVRALDAAADTVEALAIGLVVTAVVLVLLREIPVDSAVAPALGKVLYESVPFCLGIGVARHLLHGARATPDGEGKAGSGQGSKNKPTHHASSDARTVNATVADLGATVIGAAFVALSIAPTDEVPMIASAMTPAWLLIMVAASLVTSYAIVFVANFSRQDRRHAQEGIFQHPITETVVCYLLALLTALALLWVFQRGLEPWTDLLSRVVILGFPAAVGGAAGRLAV